MGVRVRVRVLAPLPHRSEAKRTKRKRGRRWWVVLVIFVRRKWQMFFGRQRRRGGAEPEKTEMDGTPNNGTRIKCGVKSADDAV